MTTLKWDSWFNQYVKHIPPEYALDECMVKQCLKEPECEGEVNDFGW